MKRADIVWRNGAKNIGSVKFLFDIFDLCRKYEIKESFVDDIKQEIWSRRISKDVWSYIASKELDVSLVISFFIIKKILMCKLHNIVSKITTTTTTECQV